MRTHTTFARAFAVALTALAASACTDGTTPVAPVVPSAPSMAKGPNALPTNGRIYFTSSFAGAGDVYSMKPDGSDRRRLTFTADAERYVNVSSDGKKLVVVSQRNDNAADRDLLTMNVDGTNSRVVATTGLDATTLAFPAFSPDGRTIAYVSNVSSDPATYGIWTASVNGGKAARLTSPTVSALYPSWSPDGSKIVYSSGLAGSGKSDLHIMNADGSNPQLLRQCADWCQNPVWSPDGSKIIYLEQDWDSIEIEYCDLLTAVPFCGNMIPHQGTPSTLALSPDGSLLVYVSQTYDNTSVHRIVTSNVNGSGQSVLTANLFALNDVAWGR